MANRYEKLKATLCPTCPLQPTCPQFTEQLDACADAEAIQKDDLIQVRIEEDMEEADEYGLEEGWQDVDF